ncbi:E3 ubiquitin-protein ligase RING1-like [Durio zibethinus]|uniref:RING-type E3 ubiquitin transferase n=1 Tax=Durio zibethinus TaxID=66656 RepID=A0A6P6A5D5_DURZI|nr:E3 ubiquitin-protein ligase RING1-like [Durio zibethinus]
MPDTYPPLQRLLNLIVGMNRLNKPLESLPNNKSYDPSRWERGNDKDGNAESSDNNDEQAEYLLRMQPRLTASHLLICFGGEKLLKLQSFISSKDLTVAETARLLEANLRLEERGLSEDTFIRRLRTRTYCQHKISLDRSTVLDKKPEPCSICLVDYEDQDKVVLLYYCKHFYHVECIKKWLLRKNQCPTCKSLAFIPQHLPDWEGDIEYHQSYFNRFYYMKYE